MPKLLIVILFLLAFQTDCIAAEAIRGKVVSVSSGDRISLQDESGEIRQIRLYGIDAPDDEQKMGQRAHGMLAAMIGDKEVEVKVNAGDSQGDPCAFISLNGLSINAAMVKSGYAWVNPETCKSSNCSTWLEYQQYAKKNKKGFWVDPEAEPPWEWRERRSKVEATAKRLNAESEYLTYYGSLANSGHRSLWAKRSLPSSSIALPGVNNNSGGGASGIRANSVASRSKATNNSGTSSSSPGPRRG